MARRRISKHEILKRKQLLDPILNKWVFYRYMFENEEKYVYIKHRLRDEKVYSKMEQIVLSEHSYERGVFFITSYDIAKVYDYKNDKEIVELSPVRFDLELGIETVRKSIHTVEELDERLIEEGYVTEEELETYSDFDNEPTGLDEVLLGMVKISEKPNKQNVS